MNNNIIICVDTWIKDNDGQVYDSPGYVVELRYIGDNQHLPYLLKGPMTKANAFAYAKAAAKKLGCNIKW